MKKGLLFFLLLISSTLGAFAQSAIVGDEEKPAISLPAKIGYKYRIAILDGDTIPMANLHELLVLDQRVFKSQEEANRYRRLIRDVKKAYPYAKLAGDKFAECERLVANVTNKHEKKVIMKRVEKELIKEYGNELENLTVTQGKILLKLIDRETGNTSYDIVKEMRGSISAFFWQSMAKLFGSDLKSEYNPEKDDKRIEEIVQLLQRGQI